MLTGEHQSFLIHQIEINTFRVQLINILCSILVILGVFGNVFGLFLFTSSRRTWRISSTYACLAICNSIINLLCMFRYASILHSTTRSVLHQFIGQTWWGCKFYEFSFSFRIISSWITLFWMFERLICISRQLQRFSHRCNSYCLKYLLPILFMILILSCVIVPPMYMYEPQIRSFANATVHIMECTVNLNASISWQNYFRDVQFGFNHFTIRCLFSELIPIGAVLLFNSCIIYQILRRQYDLYEKYGYSRRKIQSRTSSWMNIVLILHSTLFLSSLIAHIIGHFLFVEAHETWWVFLMILINCSLSFYIYCLSGQAFRSEIRRFIRQLVKRLCQRSRTHRQE